ncbi:ABC transporter ATP-binding protein, partial [Brevibacillus agri]
ILVLLIIQFILLVVTSMIGSIDSINSANMEAKLDYYVGLLVIQKSISLPLAYFEDAEFYHHLDRITKGGYGNKLLSPIKTMLGIIKSSITMISLFSFLWMIHWSLGILSILSAFPTLIIQTKFGRERFQLIRFQTPAAREANYTSALLTNRQSAKEIRIFNLGEFFKERWKKRFLLNSRNMLKLNKKQDIARILLDSITALLFGICAYIVVSLLKVGKMTIGEFISTAQGIHSAQASINGISTNLAKIYEINLYLIDLFEYLEYNDEQKFTKETRNLFPSYLQKGIFIKNLSFKYPKSNQLVLNGITIHIRPGEKVAIVGDNGSGKSTLVKCLMGLYQVEKGSVFYDDIDIVNIDNCDLHKNMTAIFQDFMKYAFTVMDNISFGDIHNTHDFELVKRIGIQTGVDDFVKKMPKDYDTLLGKILGEGEELSGGQWQKIAIARSLFRDSKILILDEPTSSLDPLKELEVYEQFNSMTNGKTVIFISHRMAAARMADKIIVLKNGKVAECGTHDDLMFLKSEYYQMYSVQAKWYS